ncbi:hypothetical protein AMS68_000946 [Peltaster fructicola]|uniref:Metallo-beta-lactamase domain-containing protein n=1 Tax=Peltaster fructicola TaxID=286661 RepID=A0A6H0XLC3_9PEZI|nr:hypothetical protein AMS68_000946 [Peltaster fructicola]
MQAEHGDPRQYVPLSGQQWTSLRTLRGNHTNEFDALKGGPGIWSIKTEPKVGIGQRCFLITTPAGNVLWDCITFVDEDTIKTIRNRGGLAAIVISHPHFYSTHLLWANIFDCPVYIAAEDAQWCVTTDHNTRRRLVDRPVQQILPGIDAIKLGGHFPGSMVLRYQPEAAPSKNAHLFIADTFMTVPSGLYHVNRPAGTTSYSFLWSYPNQIPLPPTEVYKMWTALKAFNFSSTHGGFAGQDVSDGQLKERVLESMKIQCQAMGWDASNAAIFNETVV